MPRYQNSEAAQRVLEAKVLADPEASFTPNVLCSICQAAISKSKFLAEDFGVVDAVRGGHYSYHETIPHHASIADLEMSASYGCHFCALLSNTPEREFTAWPDESFDVSEEPNSKSWQGLLLVIGFGWEVHRTSSEPFLITISQPARGIKRKTISCSRNGSVLESHPSALRLSTGSKESFALAKAWLHRCCLSHYECIKAYQSVSIRPTRLIDVGDSTSGFRLRLRLVTQISTGSALKRLEYLTLSHRWPPEPILKLAKSTLSRLMENIAMEEIPLTFQHAVIVTRQLGYRYLWIDSLCIIQDSAYDWENESANMGDIYRGSVCTIAVLTNKDSPGSGCFVTRNPLKFLPYPFSNEKLGVIWARDPCQEMLNDNELHSRGWVLQERTLSPRTLIYGEEVMMWECVTCVTNELSPNFLTTPKYENTSNLWFNLKLVFKSLARMSSLRVACPDLFSFQASYNGLIEEYSKCRLTCSQDKLVAIHGIISKLEETTGMENVAGLWKDALPEGLLWYRAVDRSGHLSPAYSGPYRAPSWSWAAVDGPVSTSLGLGVMTADHGWKLESVSVSIDADQKSNGQLKRAELIVKGPLQGLSSRSNRLGSVDWRDRFVADSPDGSERDLHALLVLSNLFCDGPSRGCRTDYGLVLRPVGERVGVYRRVGYFEQLYRPEEQWPVFASDETLEKHEITII